MTTTGNIKWNKIEEDEELFVTDDGTNKDLINKFLPEKKIKEDGIWMKCKINGNLILFRICTGTTKTFITKKLAELLEYELSNCEYEDIIIPTGIISTNKIVKVKLEIGNEVILEHSLLVVDDKMPYQVFGLDLIQQLGLILDLNEQKIFRKKNKEIIEIGNLMEFNKFIDQMDKNMENELKNSQKISDVDIPEGQFLYDFTPQISKYSCKTNSLSNMPKSKIRKVIDNMLNKEIIEQATYGDYLSPLIVEENDDGKLRIYVDYTGLNISILSQNNIILDPEIQESEYLQFFISKYFSSIRISECHQIPIAERQRYLTTFKFGSNFFRFKKLPFGLDICYNRLIWYIQNLLFNIIDDFCIINENCIIIYSSELNEHQQHLWKIIKLLNGGGLFVDYGKCQLFRKEVYYKGYVLNNHGVKICRTRLRNMINLTNPSSIIDIEILLKYIEKEAKFFEDYSYMKEELLKCHNG
ncbi:hypothetical protein SNEBB_001304, partial [Seison nebaliae]